MKKVTLQWAGNQEIYYFATQFYATMGMSKEVSKYLEIYFDSSLS